LREKTILGHEIAGDAIEVGAALTGIRVGDHVEVNPSRPCGTCRFCLAGRANRCPDMRFYGSAMRVPQMQGGFREVLVCDETQAAKFTRDAAHTTVILAETLSISLHVAR
jgi:L-idonate 5-dehydrogenase